MRVSPSDVTATETLPEPNRVPRPFQDVASSDSGRVAFLLETIEFRRLAALHALRWALITGSKEDRLLDQIWERVYEALRGGCIC